MSAPDRVLKFTGPTLNIQVYDANGDPADQGGGNGTAIVYDSAGVIAPGCGSLTAFHGVTGSYGVIIPTALGTLDMYRIAWTFPNGTQRDTYFEMVGSLLFTQAEMRAFDPVFADQTTYPDTTIVKMRQDAEERFEQIAHVSFTLRGARVRRSGNGSDVITTGRHMLQRVVTCSVDGVALAGSDLTGLIVQDWGSVTRPGGTPWSDLNRANVVMLVEHGYPVPPSPIAYAGKLYARYRLLRSPLEDGRATAILTDIGGARLSTPGAPGQPTGLPDVDAALAQFGRDPAGSFA